MPQTSAKITNKPKLTLSRGYVESGPRTPTPNPRQKPQSKLPHPNIPISLKNGPILNVRDVSAVQISPSLSSRFNRPMFEPRLPVPADLCVPFPLAPSVDPWVCGLDTWIRNLLTARNLSLPSHPPILFTREEEKKKERKKVKRPSPYGRIVAPATASPRHHYRDLSHKFPPLGFSSRVVP